MEIANNLETMVQEILTISRLETAGTEFRIEPLDCIPIIQGYLTETEDLLVQKELEVCLSLPQTAEINCNRFLIEKVFSNLLGNAIKYSPQGATIRILLQKIDRNIAFSVENT